MRPFLRSIFIFSALALFYQCSSIRKMVPMPDEPIHIEESERVAESAADSLAIAQEIIEQEESSLSGDLPIDKATQIISADSLALPLSTDTTLIADQRDRVTAKKDSTALLTDSLTVPDELIIEPEEYLLKEPVNYTAQDSIIFTDGNMGFLYGKANIEYGDMGISGEYITMDLDSNIISSTFGLDTLGMEYGHPVFEEKGVKYEMKHVRYNFDSRKAFIHSVITDQGDGTIVASEAKKNADDSFYMKDGKYSTCEKNHFYLHLSRAKVRPQKDIVTGPAWLVVADVPLFPIVLPFAFFPFTTTYSSGIIMPSYGDEMTRGFYLHNGGYYLALSDYVDLAITGEIYTKGTWGAGAKSNYRKRYKYSGNFNFYYLNTVTGEKELKEVVPEAYSEAKDLRINWTHSQDPKANMYRTLSASVNFSTSQNNHNDLSRLYSREASNNTKSSSINLTQRFPDSPWSLSATMNINQVSRDSTIAATLPNLSVNMSRIYPFKRKDAVGKEKWFEKISMSYAGEFRNSITTKENMVLKSNLIRDWTNGMRHNIPISATFSLSDFIQISPSFTYTERWYSGAHMQAWDPVAKRHVAVDTLQGFNRIYDYNMSVSAQTKLYGMFTPWKIFGDKIQAIRHVFSPAISLSYRPDFSDPKYGFYETYSYKNEYGEDVEYSYSPYSAMMFGTASKGQSGSIGFDFKNNLEMKVRSDSDTTGLKKVSLIDDLGINFQYNMMADSMNLSNINSNIRLKLSKSYTLSLNMVWDPYLYQLDSNERPVRVDKLRILQGVGLGRLMSTGTSFSYSLNQETIKKLFSRADKDKDRDSDPIDDDNQLPDDGTIGENPLEASPRRSTIDRNGDSSGQYDSDGYLNNKVAWNISFNYSLRYGYGDFDKERLEYKGKLTHNFGMSGSLKPTENWNFTFNTDYNFDLKRFTNINCTLTRNLHCWNMSASFIPIGPYKSYNFTIRANSSMLQDLKYEQQSSPYSRGMSWY